MSTGTYKNIYPNVKDLDRIPVHSEDGGKYFKVSNLPYSLSYGKHYFSISWYGDGLKDSSPLNFEFKDSDGNIIFSDVSDYEVINGSVICYVWLKKDPLRIYDEIADGVGTLTIIGELENVPSRWKGVPNVRYSIPIKIEKDTPNISPIIFDNLSNTQIGTNFTETVTTDVNSTRYKRSYLNVSASHLKLISGQIKFLEVSYREVKSQTPDFKVISRYPITGSPYEVSESIYAAGLNPLSNLSKIPLPRDVRRNKQVDFKLRFIDGQGRYAQDFTSESEKDVVVTGSISSVGGTPLTIETTDNVVVDNATLVFGTDKDTGFELGFKAKGGGKVPEERTLEFTFKEPNQKDKTFALSEKGQFIGDSESNELTSSIDAQLLGSVSSSITASNNSIIIGGSSSKLEASDNSGLFGGTLNRISASKLTTIVGGTNSRIIHHDTTDDIASQIIGAASSEISASSTGTIKNSALVGGVGNFLINNRGGDMFGQVIIGGLYNRIQNSGFSNVIVGGRYNRILSQSSPPGGGAPEDSAIIGGSSNRVLHDSSVILGMSGRHTSASNTVYVQNLDVAGTMNVNEITSSIVSSSTSILIENITSSGDSIFGNEATDTHTFFGDITASGNISASNILLPALGKVFLNSTTDTDDYLMYSSNFDSLYIQSQDINLNPINGVGINRALNYNNTATLDVDGNINTTLHITASGNISSSGNIFGSVGKFGQIEIDGESALNTTDSATTGQVFSDSQITKINIGKANTVTSTVIQGHITASGNISSSGGNITANFPDTNDDTLHYPIVVDGQNGTLESQNALAVNPSTAVVRIGSTNIVLDGDNGHITASGNISSSGTIQSTGNILTSGQFRIADVTAIDYSDPKIRFAYHTGVPIEIGKTTSGNPTTIVGNITASGNISGSSTSNLTIGGTATIGSSLSLTNTGDDAAFLAGINGLADNQPFISSLGSFSILLDRANGGTDHYFSIRRNSAIPNTGDEIFRIDESGNITGSGNISSSGFVSASHFSGDGSGLTNVTATTTLPNGVISSSLQFGSSDNVTFNHITASGNISASGNLILGGGITFDGDESILTTNGGDDLTINPDSKLRLGVSATDVVEIGRQSGTAGYVHIFANSSTVAGAFRTESISFNHPITASGNISASGDIKSNKFILANTGTEDDFIHSPAENEIELKVNNIINTEFKYNTTKFSVPIETTSHITASGNISASGGGTHIFGGPIRLINPADNTATQRIEFGNDTQRIEGKDDFLVFESDNQAVIKSDVKVNIDSPIMGVGAFTTGDTAGAVLHVSGVNATNETLIVEGSDGTDYLTVGLGGHITASGTIIAEQLTTTDDLNVGDDIIFDSEGAGLGRGVGQYGQMFFSNDIIQLGATGLGAGAFRVDGHSSTGALFVSSSGKVGIGGGFDVTNEPGEALEVVGNISSSGKVITTEVESPTDFTLDVDGNIILDANGAQIRLEDNGTEFGRFSRVSSDLVIKSMGNNNDIIFKGIDDSSTITALTLDMSDAGSAAFNNHISASGDLTASAGYFHGNTTIEKNNDGGDVSLTIRNSAASSDDETTTLNFGAAAGNIAGGVPTVLTSKIVSGRDDTYASTDTADGNLQFHVSLNETLVERLRISSNGTVDFKEGNITNVGEISVDAIKADAGAATQMQFQAGLILTETADITFNDGNDDKKFQVKGSSDDNLLQVNPTNNDRVGIGTATPAKKLTVHGDISASGHVRTPAVSGSGNLTLQNAVSTVQNKIVLGNYSGTSITWINSSNNDVDTYILGDTHNFLSGTPLFHADAGEETIGIGTPGVSSAKLSVGGNIRATGDISSSLTGSFGNLQIDGVGDAFLEVQGNISGSSTSILSVGDIQIVSGTLDIKNQGAQSQIKMYCDDANQHFQTIKAAPHSDGASNTLTLPNVGTVFSTTDGTQTLTNKTLTSPDINTPDIDGGTIDNSVIGSNTAVAGTFTTLTSTGNTTIGDNNPADIHTITGRSNFVGSITSSGAISSSGTLFAELTTKTDINKLVTYDTDTGQFHMTASSAFLGSGGGGGGAVASVANGVNNRVATFSDTDALNGEANLTFDGTTLTTDGNFVMKQTGSMQFNLFDTGSAPNGHSFGSAGMGVGDIVKFGQDYTGGATVPGDVYFLLPTGLWRQAGGSGVGLGSDELLAIALGTDPAVHGMLLRGLVRVSQGLSTIGTAVYLDASAPGHMSQTAPNGNNQIVRIIGYCTDDSTNQMYFNPDSTFVKITA